MKSGDFLADLDIEIVIRSSQTDLVILQRLAQVIVTSVTELVDTEIVLIELEDKVKVTSEKKLFSIKRILQTK